MAQNLSLKLISAFLVFIFLVPFVTAKTNIVVLPGQAHAINEKQEVKYITTTNYYDANGLNINFKDQIMDVNSLFKMYPMVDIAGKVTEINKFNASVISSTKTQEITSFYSFGKYQINQNITSKSFYDTKVGNTLKNLKGSTFGYVIETDYPYSIEGDNKITINKKVTIDFSDVFEKVPMKYSTDKNKIYVTLEVASDSFEVDPIITTDAYETMSTAPFGPSSSISIMAACDETDDTRYAWIVTNFGVITNNITIDVNAGTCDSTQSLSVDALDSNNWIACYIDENLNDAVFSTCDWNSCDNRYTINNNMGGSADIQCKAYNSTSFYVLYDNQATYDTYILMCHLNGGCNTPVGIAMETSGVRTMAFDYFNDSLIYVALHSDNDNIVYGYEFQILANGQPKSILTNLSIETSISSERKVAVVKRYDNIMEVARAGYDDTPAEWLIDATDNSISLAIAYADSFDQRMLTYTYFDDNLSMGTYPNHDADTSRRGFWSEAAAYEGSFAHFILNQTSTAIIYGTSTVNNLITGNQLCDQHWNTMWLNNTILTYQLYRINTTFIEPDTISVGLNGARACPVYDSCPNYIGQDDYNLSCNNCTIREDMSILGNWTIANVTGQKGYINLTSNVTFGLSSSNIFIYPSCSLYVSRGVTIG